MKVVGRGPVRQKVAIGIGVKVTPIFMMTIELKKLRLFNMDNSDQVRNQGDSWAAVPLKISKTCLVARYINKLQ